MLFIHQRIQSFLNLGACKEYPIMAKPKFPKKSTDVAAALPTQNTPSTLVNTEQAEVRLTASIPATPAKETVKAAAPKVARKPEIVRSESRTEPRTNLVPINLDEEIRRQAYLFSERRGFAPGHEREDWLAAEHEVRQRYHQQQSA
jgi:hypothetical protein